ncbi:MAG: BtpA/SgcQ family protein, partial [Verrucomicrobiota bacterium]
HALPMGDIVDRAVAEARILEEAGFDAVLIENMHDRPYTKGAVGPEIVAALSRVAAAVRSALAIPIGLQVLAAANRESLAVACANQLDFVRVEGFVFAHVADEGWIDGSAADLLRYRRQIGAEDVLILTDIQKKHSSHAITADLPLEDLAKGASFFLSDGIILTGHHTGEVTCPDQVAAVRQATSLPLLVGSGITAGNLADYWDRADGVIVGSSIKEKGLWDQALDRERIGDMVASARRLESRN